MKSPSSADAAVKLRETPAVTQDVLNQLDQRSGGPSQATKRRALRYPYRIVDLKVDVIAPNGQVRRFLAPTRNLSRTGLGLLVGQFVFPKLKCVVELISRNRQRQRVSGVVAHCRYLSRSNLHEVGICFDQPIDVALFRRDPRRCILLALAGAPEHTILLEKLRTPENRIVVTPPAGAVAEVEKSAYDAVVIDLNTAAGVGGATLSALRQTGFSGLLLGLCGSEESEDVRAGYASAGCSVVLPRPVDLADLEERLLTACGEPLRSSLRTDPVLIETIDAFVMQLCKRLYDLEAAARQNLWPILRAGATELRLEAAAAGFEPLAQLAGEIENASKPDAPDPAALASALRALALAASRARPETLGLLPAPPPQPEPACPVPPATAPPEPAKADA